MREINMMDGRKILISREEYRNILNFMNSGKTGVIELRSHEMINPLSISSITIPEIEATFWGNPMNKARTAVLVDGEWKTFAGEQEQIEYRLKNHRDRKISAEDAKRLRIELSKDFSDSDANGLAEK